MEIKWMREDQEKMRIILKDSQLIELCLRRVLKHKDKEVDIALFMGEYIKTRMFNEK